MRAAEGTQSDLSIHWRLLLDSAGEVGEGLVQHTRSTAGVVLDLLDEPRLRGVEMGYHQARGVHVEVVDGRGLGALDGVVREAGSLLAVQLELNEGFLHCQPADGPDDLPKLPRADSSIITLGTGLFSDGVGHPGPRPLAHLYQTFLSREPSDNRARHSQAREPGSHGRKLKRT